jgi:rubredoxin
MAQLVGTTCVFCRHRIGSILDGRFCDICKSPMHTRCCQPEAGRSGEGRCPRCGADQVQVAELLDQDRAKRVQSVYRMENYPVSRVCPKCGSSEYSKRRTQKWIAFTSNRVCKSCSTRYTPPTPAWAGVIFILAGFLLVGIGGISILARLPTANPLELPAMACEGFIGFLGALAIIHGIRSLLRLRKV